VAEHGDARIGVSTYLERAQQGVWDERFGLVPETYLIAIERAGGIPMLLPPQPVRAGLVDRVLDGLEGLVLTGGADLDATRYGAEPGPNTQRARLDRDAWEIALVIGALERDMPILAICRGLQLLNVALGGTLHQHVPDVVGSSRHAPTPGRYGTNQIAVEPASPLGALLGETVTVRCHHHQAIDRVADRLVVAAHSATDGIVEAATVDGARFAVGVQWHPEESPDDLRLFDAFLAATQHPDLPLSVASGVLKPQEMASADVGLPLSAGSGAVLPQEVASARPGTAEIAPHTAASHEGLPG
jgi:putative glutamine amidotransferase